MRPVTLEAILVAGDRVEFKRYIAQCSDSELMTAYYRTSARRIQDFAELASAEGQRRDLFK